MQVEQVEVEVEQREVEQREAEQAEVEQAEVEQAEVEQAEVEQRRKREREKKQRQRASMTAERRETVLASERKRDAARRPARRMKNAERMQRKRANMTAETKAAESAKGTARRQQKARSRPFITVDFEGAGKNAYGQQNLVVGGAFGEGFARQLHKGIGECNHISSVEAFDWILSLPGKDDAILVSYFFGWDVTQILRTGIGTKVAADLFNRHNYGHGGTRYWTHFNRDYAVKFISKRYLAVARRGGPKNRPLPETARYIFDVFGLFQTSFVKTAKLWFPNDPRIEPISDMKNLRDKFDAVTPEMLTYNRDECQILAEIMTRFREHCYAAEISPREWSTAGILASALMVKHHLPKRPPETAEERTAWKGSRAVRRPERPRDFERAARYAYFGGRQETTRRGYICGEVFRHDIHSAYPSKLLELPCQLHMHVRRLNSKTPPAEGLYLAWGQFRHPPETVWGGLPVRDDKSFGTYWPLDGFGWWWSPEIRKAQQHLGMTMKFEEIWIVESPCQCEPFGFVRDLYAKRNELGEKTEGLPIKFAMSAISGKFLQKDGVRPWYDLPFAGLVNSLTRAQLTEAIGVVGQRETLMLMTDAVYTKKPLPPSMTGDGLGQFGPAGPADRLNGMWIVKPGLHWSDLSHAKTRGIPSSVIADDHGKFEREWHGWLKRNMPGDGPVVRVEFPVCISLKTAALAYRDLKRAGRWEMIPSKYGFGWSTKHHSERFERHGDEVWLWPLNGSTFIENQPYKASMPDDDDDGLGSDKMDGMPDYVPVME